MIYKSIFIGLLLVAFNALAEDETPMKFRIESPCEGNADICVPSIYAEGVIEADSDQRFFKFYNLAKKNLKNNLPDKPTVILTSPGGSVIGGIKLGEKIRDLGLTTYIPYDSYCASSCTLAFIGGLKRRLDPDAKYGVHQFSTVSGNSNESTTQITVVLLADYIERMGVNRTLLDLASLVPPSEIHWIPDEQRKSLRVDNSEPLIEDWILDTDQQGKTYARARAYFSADTPIVDYLVVKDGYKLLLFLKIGLVNDFNGRVSNFTQTMGNDGKVDFIFDSSSAVQSNQISWRQNGSAIFGTVEIPWSLLNVIKGKNEMEINFNIARAASDLDPTVTFSARKLERILPAIIK